MRASIFNSSRRLGLDLGSWTLTCSLGNGIYPEMQVQIQMRHLFNQYWPLQYSRLINASANNG